MFTKLCRPMTLALVAALVLALVMVSPTTAAPLQPAKSRDAAAAPLAGWVTLQPGETHWYKFVYRYDGSDNPPQALVTMKLSRPSAANFAIETASNLALPKQDKDGHWRGPVGVGAPMSLKIHNHDGTDAQIKAEKDAADEHAMIQKDTAMIWSGGGKATTTFYVVVTNSQPHACNYQLTISGKTVSY